MGVAAGISFLSHLGADHKGYMRLNTNKQLQLSEQALSAVEQQSELASVITDQDDTAGDVTEDDGIVQAAMESGLSKSEVYTFDKYPNLYKKGLIKIVEDNSQRQPTYTASANLCFPHLYPNSLMEMFTFLLYLRK